MMANNEVVVTAAMTKDVIAKLDVASNRSNNN
jgi:hypothetical protein